MIATLYLEVHTQRLKLARDPNAYVIKSLAATNLLLLSASSGSAKLSKLFSK